jgi:hypothetical protein
LAVQAAPTKAPVVATAAAVPPPPSGGTTCAATFPNGSTKTCYTTLAGQTIPAGQVCAEIFNTGSSSNATITYDMSTSAACLKEVHAYLGDTIPANSKGNPTPGNFPYTALISAACLKKYSFTMPLSPDCSPGNEYVNRPYKMAAHASVDFTDGNGSQTAWSVGKEVTPGGSWATYSEVVLNCACGTVRFSSSRINMQHVR